MQKPTLSDDKILSATGKTWSQWFALLDKVGAKNMEHRDIAELVHRKYKVPGWWSQTVTVEYERSRKGRKKHQRLSGDYEVSLVKTVPVSTTVAYRAWSTPAKRSTTIGRTFAATTVRPGKVVRGKLADGTSLVVSFTTRPKGKSHVSVMQGKLTSAAAAAKAKRYWRARLEKFASNL